MPANRTRSDWTRKAELEPSPHAELNLARAIEVRRVDVERLAKLGLPGLEAGEEIESRQAAVRRARFDRVADRLKFGHVLVIEEVEALGQQFELAHRTRD